jgi:copper/silver efflux system protein
MMPAFAHWLFSIKFRRKNYRFYLNIFLIAFGLLALFWVAWAGVVLILLGIHGLIFYLHKNDPERLRKISGSRFQPAIDYSIRHHETITVIIIAAAVSWLLASEWLPLGVENNIILEFSFYNFYHRFSAYNF